MDLVREGNDFFPWHELSVTPCNLVCFLVTRIPEVVYFGEWKR